MTDDDIHIDASKYREELDYLISYAKEDWVPFHPVQSGAEGTLLPGREDRSIDITVRLISDLYDAGVRPIDLLATDDPPYAVWDLPKDAALARIRLALEGLTDSADALDICWFTHVG
ncbi:hypothetical protein O4J56_10430 [Nocardiopsis sp. RSe5-2]|uniref:Uncharacterized protein n=1 Tax=Nocardiopsis endophytica TaxID=3018445 RepID=A0ABT4U280_9ACTN|nr:hypothetical protein [Nocardiopsis endophytica]MDA2811052.1 hypothetical protein [Nocardiopsis endophytica]